MIMLEEIKEIERQEKREYEYRQWVEDNRPDLESDFINTFPPEEQPLDDDTPEFLQNYSEEFEDFCKDVYKEMI